MIYHYDLSGQLIAETDGSGNMIKAYVWLSGQPLAMIASDGSIYYFHNDHLGTPQKLTDSTGALVWSADYLPFGRADVNMATVDNNLRFAGQYYDSETGLHYNYHRYYDPSLGRYLRADPIGLKGGINLYTYVDGNPVNLLDPFGLYYGTDSGTASFNAAMAGGNYSEAAAIAEAMGWGAGMAMANAAATSSVNPESRTIPMPDAPIQGADAPVFAVLMQMTLCLEIYLQVHRDLLLVLVLQKTAVQPLKKQREQQHVN